VFSDIISSAGLTTGDRVVEIGAGTGIATEELVDHGLRVTAIEPSDTLAAIAESKVANQVRFVISRFEEFSHDAPVQLLTAFNAWHWVDPRIGTGLAARVLDPGGSIALVWTEVVAWGQEPFEERLAEIFGRTWPKREDLVDHSLTPIREDARFDQLRVSHHPFERTLDASTFVAVTQTYGGNHTGEQYQAIQRIIDDEFGGTITKIEDAALYLARRR
jgi:ubiquinone/menaquinone biosynthesis C-methylase UbiE